MIGIAATTTIAPRASQRRLAPTMKSMPSRIAAENERRAQVGLDQHQHEGRCHEQACADGVRQAADAVLAGGQVGRQHADHQDLGHL